MTDHSPSAFIEPAFSEHDWLELGAVVTGLPSAGVVTLVQLVADGEGHFATEPLAMSPAAMLVRVREIATVAGAVNRGELWP